MKPIKKSPSFANGGSWGDVDYDTPKSKRELRKEEREDKKGMIRCLQVDDAEQKKKG